MGTMGTAAGLAIGFALAGLDTDVRAVRITSRIATHGRGLRALVARTLRLLQPAGAPLPSIEAVIARIRVNHRCIGRGYGQSTEDAERAAELFAEAGDHAGSDLHGEGGGGVPGWAGAGRRAAASVLDDAGGGTIGRFLKSRG
jgi:D-cysteine desulfhydrase